MQDENSFATTTDGNPFCKDVVLRRPEDFKPGERQQISLHLLVKNGESCIGRLLANVGPYIDEIVAIVNDTTDQTIPILREHAAARGPGFSLDIVEVTHESHPRAVHHGRPGDVHGGQAVGRRVLCRTLHRRPHPEIGRAHV